MKVVQPEEEEIEPLLEVAEIRESPKFDPSFTDIVKTPRFRILFFMLFASMSFTIWVIVCFKSFASPYIIDDGFLNTVGVIASICNCIARFIFPALMDHISYKALNCIALSLQVVLSVVIYFSVQSPPMFLLIVSLTYITNASQFYPTAVAANIIYGKHGQKAFSLIAWGCVLASLAPSVYFYVFVENFGYLSSFLFGGVLSIMALISCSFLEMDPEWREVSLVLSFKD